MNKLYGRIVEYISKADIGSIRQFEIDANIANGTIGKLEADENKGLNGETLKKISSKYKDLDIHWLVTGDGSMTIRKMKRLSEEGKDYIAPGTNSKISELQTEIYTSEDLMSMDIEELKEKLEDAEKYNDALKSLIELYEKKFGKL